MNTTADMQNASVIINDGLLIFERMDCLSGSIVAAERSAAANAVTIKYITFPFAVPNLKSNGSESEGSISDSAAAAAR